MRFIRKQAYRRASRGVWNDGFLFQLAGELSLNALDKGKSKQNA